MVIKCITSRPTRPFYTPRRFAMLCIKRPVNSNVMWPKWRAVLYKLLLYFVILSTAFLTSCAMQLPKTGTVIVPTPEEIDVAIQMWSNCRNKIEIIIKVKREASFSMPASFPCSTFKFHGSSPIIKESLSIVHPYYKFQKYPTADNTRGISGEHKPIFDYKKLIDKKQNNSTNISTDKIRDLLHYQYIQMQRYIRMMNEDNRKIPDNIKLFIKDLLKYRITITAAMSDEEIKNITNWRYEGLPLNDKREKINAAAIKDYNHILTLIDKAGS